MQIVKASCGCVGAIDGENFVATTFNCKNHKIGVKYVYSLNLRKKRTTINAKNIKPHLEELVLRCGGVKQAAEFSGLTTATIQRIGNDHYKTVRMKTARRVMDSLLRKREEDRQNYTVNSELRKNIKKKVDRETKFEIHRNRD